MNAIMGVRAGEMMGYGYRYGARGDGHPLIAFFFLVAFLAAVGLVVWFLISRARTHHTATYAPAAQAAPTREDAAVTIVRERYARGEIDTEQYLNVVNALTAPTALTAPAATSPATHQEPLPPAAPTAEG